MMHIGKQKDDWAKLGLTHYYTALFSQRSDPKTLKYEDFDRFAKTQEKKINTQKKPVRQNIFPYFKDLKNKWLKSQGKQIIK